MSATKPTLEEAQAQEFQYPNYTYRVRSVDNIVDGDTIDVELDLGFDTKVTKRLRYLLLDAWETRGEERPEGLIATDRMTELLETADKVFVQTVMDAEGKFGRVLAWVWVEKDGKLTNTNLQMIVEGHGDVYE